MAAKRDQIPEASGQAAGWLSRRSLVHGCVATGVVTALPRALATPQTLGSGRPPVADRRFSSPVIEDAIANVKRLIADPALADMFERCFPNTLDTTVYPSTLNGAPDTFVVTGDIDAMWQRDSSAQVWPYLRFARRDPRLASLLEGVVRRQARSVLIDPYANSFTRTTTDPALSWALNDKTEMRPGVAERKWEIDSLCYVLRFAHGYWQATGDKAPFKSEWKAAAWKIVQTFREQQRFTDQGPYSFQRKAEAPTDTLPLHGFGNPARPNGMIFSMFRPSDDACIYPFLIPSNLFAIHSLTRLREMAVNLYSDNDLVAACTALIADITAATKQFGTVIHPTLGQIWAYEVDGYGNTLMMDDANAPGLLSLPYLGICDVNDPLYRRSRQFALSPQNPYFFKGSAAEGIGGPHIGMGFIWPMSITLRALTSVDDADIMHCLKWLRDTTAGTGFVHESFDQNDASKFTRSWFAWANTLFGELILKLADKGVGPFLTASLSMRGIGPAGFPMCFNKRIA